MFIKPEFHGLLSLELGSYLAEQKIAVLYGGSMFGCMGRLAQSVLDGGGKITGIIPKFFTGENLFAEGIKILSDGGIATAVA